MELDATKYNTALSSHCVGKACDDLSFDFGRIFPVLSQFTSQYLISHQFNVKTKQLTLKFQFQCPVFKHSDWKKQFWSVWCDESKKSHCPFGDNATLLAALNVNNDTLIEKYVILNGEYNIYAPDEQMSSDQIIFDLSEVLHLPKSKIACVERFSQPKPTNIQHKH